MTPRQKNRGPIPVAPEGADAGGAAGSDLLERLTLAVENALELLEAGDVQLAKGYLEVARELLTKGR